MALNGVIPFISGTQFGSARRRTYPFRTNDAISSKISSDTHTHTKLCYFDVSLTSFADNPILERVIGSENELGVCVYGRFFVLVSIMFWMEFH